MQSNTNKIILIKKISINADTTTTTALEITTTDQNENHNLTDFESKNNKILVADIDKTSERYLENNNLPHRLTISRNSITYNSVCIKTQTRNNLVN